MNIKRREKKKKTRRIDRHPCMQFELILLGLCLIIIYL